MDSGPSLRAAGSTSLHAGTKHAKTKSVHTKGKVRQSCSEPLRLLRLGTADACRLVSLGALGWRETAEPEKRQKKKNGKDGVAEVTELLLTLSGTPTAEKAARTTDPKLSAAHMCAKVRAATVRSYVRAWRPLWRWWSGSGKQGLPSSGEAVLTYLDQELPNLAHPQC